jgi:hypothetical protein
MADTATETVRLTIDGNTVSVPKGGFTGSLIAAAGGVTSVTVSGSNTLKLSAGGVDLSKPAEVAAFTRLARAAKAFGGYAREKAGAAAVDQIVASIPGLSQFV